MDRFEFQTDVLDPHSGKENQIVSHLEVEHMSKTFGTKPVLRGVHLSVPSGQTLAVLGQSGSGKTTLLKILAGLEAPVSGRVVLDGHDVTRVAPEQRNMVYLYQQAYLFPHMNTFDNVAFGLRANGASSERVRLETTEILQSLGISDLAGHWPEQLSGGQAQRVAFARALMVRPRVLLLDEPFSALDGHTRSEMRAFFRKVADTFQMTAIFVTHDLKEALSVGHRFARLSEGVLRTFDHREAFLSDPDVGAYNEYMFWKATFDGGGVSS
jgi:ABC-type sulfate/molybdate transport systems ATPase subunit